MLLTSPSRVSSLYLSDSALGTLSKMVDVLDRVHRANPIKSGSVHRFNLSSLDAVSGVQQNPVRVINS